MKVLIIGAGQIGTAIQRIILPFHTVFIRDIEEGESYPPIDVLHICYPDSRKFVAQTLDYIRKYRPSFTIIHSSIGVGKTAECGPGVVHVPVRGRHPKLAAEIPAFKLLVGGTDPELVKRACEYLNGCNLVAIPAGNPEGTELCKLLSNIHMGLEIAWRQEVGRILDNYGVPVLTYKDWEESYNLGYRVTGDEHLTRPVMRPDPIGGHCILQCTEILAKQYGSKAFDFIQESNEKAKRDQAGSGPAVVPGPEAARA